MTINLVFYLCHLDGQMSIYSQLLTLYEDMDFLSTESAMRITCFHNKKTRRVALSHLTQICIHMITVVLTSKYQTKGKYIESIPYYIIVMFHFEHQTSISIILTTQLSFEFTGRVLRGFPREFDNLYAKFVISTPIHCVICICGRDVSSKKSMPQLWLTDHMPR